MELYRELAKRGDALAARDAEVQALERQIAQLQGGVGGTRSTAATRKSPALEIPALAELRQRANTSEGN